MTRSRSQTEEFMSPWSTGPAWRFNPGDISIVSKPVTSTRRRLLTDGAANIKKSLPQNMDGSLNYLQIATLVLGSVAMIMAAYIFAILF